MWKGEGVDSSQFPKPLCNGGGLCFVMTIADIGDGNSCHGSGQFTLSTGVLRKTREEAGGKVAPLTGRAQQEVFLR